MQSFRVGDFVVEPELNRIRRAPRTAHIESKAMEVLVYLAEHPKQVLPKERIIQAVWPDTFVTDDVLTHAISELRKAFEDDARDPRFIQTIPRKGYRLIAPVSRESLEVAPTSLLPWRTAPSRLMIGGLMAVFVLAAVLYWFYPFAVVDPMPLDLEAIPLTSYPGREVEPSFSPDGNRVAFAWDGEKGDNTDIYVKGIGPGGQLRLTEHPATDFGPAWSPNDDYIAFLRGAETKRNVTVLLVPPLGGAERTLATTLFPQRRPDQFHAPYLAWSPDGKWLVVIDKETRDTPFALFLVSLATGEKRRLTRPPADFVGDSSPAFSPDGRTLAFSRQFTREVGDLYLLALTEQLEPDGPPRRFTTAEGLSTSPTWDSKGQALVYSAGFGMQHRLWRKDAFNAGEPQRLAVPGVHSESPAISRRTGRLVFSSHIDQVDIWRSELTGPGVGAGRPVRLISSTQQDFLPEYSPDGKRIAFDSTRSGSEEIWVCDSDGSNPMQLTVFGGPRTGSPRWSPDGERIAFDSRAGGQADIYVIGRDGGRPKRLTTNPSNDLVPTWSRDGGWIYFTSNRSERPGIFKVPAEGGEAIQVTEDFGWAATESSDGEFLYYQTREGLWRLPLDIGAEPTLLLGSVKYASFEIVDQGVYFVPRTDEAGSVTSNDFTTGGVGSVMFWDFATGETELVCQMEGPPSDGLSISPEGLYLLYSQGHQGADLMLVENFR